MTRIRAFGLLFAGVLSAALSSSSCGVMFGAEEPDYCGEQSCSSAQQCPLTTCVCRDSTMLSANSCITEKGCCGKPWFLCETACDDHDGWTGQAGGTGGTGGSGGSAGRGGSGGTGGSSGSATGGSAGTGMQIVAGASCMRQNAVTCGCLSSADTACNSVLLCLPAGWAPRAQCDAGVTCFMSSSRTSAACGTTDLYLPYAQLGAACGGASDSFACSLDRRNTLECIDGTWQSVRSCTSPAQCRAIPDGDPLCDSETFCVGCT